MPQKRTTPRICLHCGKHFLAWDEARRNPAAGQFCGSRCRAEARRQGKIRRICKMCGSSFDVFPYVAAEGRGLYCSKACYDEAQRSKPDTSQARFWRDTHRTETCWVWTGQQSTTGYGLISVRGKGRKAHRFSWELHNGPIPDGLMVCHHCDNRLCVNPAHLFLGISLDNVRDMDTKGRRKSNPSVGEKRPHAKLTEAEVRDMRARSEQGATLASLARAYNTSISNVSQIIRRKTWTHI